MSEIEKLQRYIDRTNGAFPRGTPYQMNINEMFALAHMAAENVTEAICLAFDYGRAKGYRAAKKEVRR